MFQLIQIKDRDNQGHSLSVKAVILFNSADLWASYLPSEVMRSIYVLAGRMKGYLQILQRALKPGLDIWHLPWLLFVISERVSVKETIL